MINTPSIPYLILLQCLTFLNSQTGLKTETISDHCKAFLNSGNIMTCNRVVHETIPTQDEVQKIKTFFGDHAFTWIIRKDDEITSHMLEQNGLLDWGTYPAMEIDSTFLQSQSYSPAIEIKKIDISEPTLDTWAQIVAQSFNLEKSEILKVVHCLHSQLKPQALSLYLGFYNGTAAAAAYAIHHEDVTSLHWIGTAPDLRNRGLGYAITHSMSLDAKNNGCNKVILFASHEGKPLYEKVGFKEYCSYRIYYMHGSTEKIKHEDQG